MQKQVVYADLIPRIFATMLDMLIVALVLTPVTGYIGRHLLAAKLLPFIKDNPNFNIRDDSAFQELITRPDVNTYLNDNFFNIVIQVSLPNIIIVFIVLTLYFIYFGWKGSTPGQYILRLKIANADNYERISFLRSTIRFMLSTVLFVGLVWVFFTKKRQALHDRIVNTVVIKI